MKLKEFKNQLPEWFKKKYDDYPGDSIERNNRDYDNSDYEEADYDNTDYDPDIV